MRGRSRALTAVCAASVGYAAVLFTVASIRYRIFRAQVDLGLFTQVIASSLHGFSSTAEGGENHLGVHFSPILVACAPLLWLAQTPATLIAIQAIAAALVAPPTYLLAVRRVGPRLAFLNALTSLVYPPLVAITVDDFHELAFATPVILWLAWAIDARRWRIAAWLAALSLCIKEDVSLILALLAAVLALRAILRHEAVPARFFGRFALAATAVVVVFFFAVRPGLSGMPIGHPYLSEGYYDWHATGASPRGFADLDSPLRAEYLRGVFVPLLAVPLLSPAIFLALPGLLEILGSHAAITLDLESHYAPCWMPYVLLAFVFGIANVAKRSMPLAFIVLALVLGTSIYVDAYASPAQWWYQIYRMPTARDAELDRTLQTLPHDAVIGADLWLFAHLGLHPNATFDVTKAGIVVVDRRCDSEYCRTQVFPAVAERVARGDLQLRSAHDGIEVYAVPGEAVR
jgi:uncharacterized membrane protein